MFRSENVRPVVATELLDDRWAFGTLDEYVHDTLRCSSCTFFHDTVADIDDLAGSATPDLLPIASVMVTDDIRTGRSAWLTGHDLCNPLAREHWPVTTGLQTGYIGVPVRGTALVRKFLNAYHGLLPWDAMHDPDYYEGYLLPGATPTRRYKADFPG